MSADLPAALADQTTSLHAEGQPWVETVLAIFLVTAAVLLASFISVVTSL